MATSQVVGRSADADADASPSILLSLEQPNSDIPVSNHGTSAAAVERRLPNPEFVFPARPTSPSSTPVAKSHRRPLSMVNLHHDGSPCATPTVGSGRSHRPSALPQFSFNPGAALPLDASALSPPITPGSARLIPSPSRPAGHGHRRGGSEFVGGSIRDGNSIAIMNTSPTKSESGFTSPGLHPSRRGHRRGISGAISVSDLPILHPKPDFLSPKGSSAPNSPTTLEPSRIAPLSLHVESPLPDPANAAPLSLSDSTVENTISNHSIPTPTSPSRVEPSLRQARSGRARVGFSDTLEFIPRPLSIVSSDTSSTLTARPGHSVSGSISSVVSAASPGGRDSPALPPQSPTRESIGSRPSTAGAILEGTADTKPASDGENSSPRRRNSIPTLLDLALSQSINTVTSSPTKTSKRWSLFGSAPSSKHRSCSSSSSESLSKTASAVSSSDQDSEASEDETTCDVANSAKKDRKKTSRKRRVKGWAGSILPLRSNKRRHARRPPTPPASADPAEDEDDQIDGRELDGQSSIEPSVAIPNESLPTEELEKSPALRHRPEEENTSSMIDLDAALGPFNTPLPHNPEWDAAQRAAGNTGKRRLHSAQGMKGFSGPGMHYHRRAESAPDLPPFDPGRAGIHRFGSSSTMADVFEEDEEEAEAGGKSRHAPINSAKQPLAIDDSCSSDGETTPPATMLPLLPSEHSAPGMSEASSIAVDCRRSSSGTSNTDHSSSLHVVRAECSKTSLHEEVIAEDRPSIIFRSAYCGSPKEHHDSASSSPRLPPTHEDMSPIESHQTGSMGNAMMMTIPISPYSTSHASSYPSPRSPMSIDVQRISTAPSSVTDQNSFHSLLMGEPGPELRVSMDYDIPSLASSISTTTRDSAFASPARTSQPSLREHRPVSVSSAAFGRRRSSLVSLSRLISSSHGERSKLSMEVTLDSEAEGKRGRSKTSKTKRLSRMMQFWKPSKDGSTT